MVLDFLQKISFTCCLHQVENIELFFFELNSFIPHFSLFFKAERQAKPFEKIIVKYSPRCNNCSYVLAILGLLEDINFFQYFVLSVKIVYYIEKHPRESYPAYHIASKFGYSER